MIPKLGLLIILLHLGYVILETSEQENGAPSTSHGKPDGCLGQKESYLEISNALNQTLNRLESVRDEIDAKMEILENKFKSYETRNENLKKEIISIVKNLNTLPKDCKDAKNKGSGTSGIYRIRPELAEEDFLVWCDMTTRGGGWTHVLNRFDGSQDFYKNWTDYKQGFGKLSGEHWLGLEHLYYLTGNRPNELLIELADWNSVEVYATYDNFTIENETEGYKIASLGTYEGDAGDSFSDHLGYKFSTVDRDQDEGVGDENCALTFRGAWWYNSCYNCHLTGTYVQNAKPDTKYDSAILWYHFHGYMSSLKTVRMMIRPIELE